MNILNVLSFNKTYAEKNLWIYLFNSISIESKIINYINDNKLLTTKLDFDQNQLDFKLRPINIYASIKRNTKLVTNFDINNLLYIKCSVSKHYNLLTTFDLPVF